MLFSQVINFATFAIFFSSLITQGHFDRPKSATEIPRSYHEVQTVLSDWDIIFDYFEMEIIRRYIVLDFPNDDFFFVGNSLAYIGLEMIVRNQLVGATSGITRFVPFSGNHIGIIRDSDREYHFIRNPEDYPADEELENYKKQLLNLRLNPRSIFERYERSGHRTVIVKDVGLGLVSFLDILLNWARLEGISPNRLRIALKVCGVISENNGFPDTSVITIGEYSIDMVRFELTENSLETIRRISCPERNTGYVRIVPNYPSQLWNEPLQELGQQHRQQLDEYINRLARVMIRMADILPLRPRRNGSDLDQVCRSLGVSRERRSKKDLISQDLIKKQIHPILTSNKDAFETLKMEHDKSLMKTSSWDLIESQLKNPTSDLSRILKKACEKYDFSIDMGRTVLLEQVHYSSEKTLIYQCMRRHRLLRCDKFYASSGIIEEIAEVTSKKLSGQTITLENVENEAESLIYKLMKRYSKFPVDYLVEATKEAALYCSDEKITPTLECPSYHRQYIGQMMLAWFDELMQEKYDPRAQEIVD